MNNNRGDSRRQTFSHNRGGQAGGRPRAGGFRKGPRPGGGRRPGGPGGKKKLPPALIKQAKTLVDQSGIPFNAALRVAQGKTTLNDVLQELLREEKIKKLIETHNINRALATNVALGRTDLEVVLLRRRKNLTLQEHYSRSCLEEAKEKGTRIALGMHGFQKIIGNVVDVDKYTFKFQETEQSEAVEYHKTQVKFAYDPDQYKQLRKFMKIDSKTKAMGLEPILRAKERHHFKNLSLQRSLDERVEVTVTTLEGDVFRGQVEWFGRWEFGLKFKGGARLTVFRHAVLRLDL